MRSFLKNKAKRQLRHGSKGTVLASHRCGPEFKPQYCKERNFKKVITRKTIWQKEAEEGD
jgi:hypothetical protein